MLLFLIAYYNLIPLRYSYAMRAVQKVQCLNLSLNRDNTVTGDSQRVALIIQDSSTLEYQSTNVSYVETTPLIIEVRDDDSKLCICDLTRSHFHLDQGEIILVL